LKKVFVSPNSLDSQDKDVLNQMQLWWDRELSTLTSEEKKFSHIKNVISATLKDFLKQILKSNIDNELKQKLLNNMKNI